MRKPRPFCYRIASQFGNRVLKSSEFVVPTSIIAAPLPCNDDSVRAGRFRRHCDESNATHGLQLPQCFQKDVISLAGFANSAIEGPDMAPFRVRRQCLQANRAHLITLLVEAQLSNFLTILEMDEMPVGTMWSARHVENVVDGLYPQQGLDVRTVVDWMSVHLPLPNNRAAIPPEMGDVAVRRSLFAPRPRAPAALPWAYSDVRLSLRVDQRRGKVTPAGKSIRSGGVISGGQETASSKSTIKTPIGFSLEGSGPPDPG